MKFQGYVRRDGTVGVRNHLLILSIARGTAALAEIIARSVTGAVTWCPNTDAGRDREDRLALGRLYTGLAASPNVGAVLVVGTRKGSGHPELSQEMVFDPIMRLKKPVDHVLIEDHKFHEAIGIGIQKARVLARAASDARREEVGLDALRVSVKCGISDATSGVAGNPTVGYLFDKIVDAGGVVMFGETTETIGAEHIVAKRFAHDADREKFLAAVNRIEAQALASGQDIRTINPIPANIAGGITTLEEKSLGGISKTGTTPINGFLEHCEHLPENAKGLYFTDCCPLAAPIYLNFSGQGANLHLFQFGGGGMAPGGPAFVSHVGVVTPVFFCTGNARVYEDMRDELDFCSAPIYTEKKSVAEMGERLAAAVCNVASGSLTKCETLNISDPTEFYYRHSSM